MLFQRIGSMGIATAPQGKASWTQPAESFPCSRFIAFSFESRIVCEPSALLSSRHVYTRFFLIIQCTSCQARYQYDEDRFERKPAKKIKCAKCGTIFEIHN